MNVVDAGGWIEYFTDGPAAVSLVNPIQRTDELLVPTLTLFEVYRHVLRNTDRASALRAAAAMRKGRVVELDASLALEAAEFAVKHELPHSAAVAFAVARAHDAILWTLDHGLAGLPGVRVQGTALRAGSSVRGL